MLHLKIEPPSVPTRKVLSSASYTFPKLVPPTTENSVPLFLPSKCPLIGYLSLSPYRQRRILPSVETLTKVVVIAMVDSDSCLTQISFVTASLWKYSSISDLQI